MDEVRPTMVPYFGYRDAAEAIAWLGEALGFHEVQVYSTPEGEVIHAEMSFGGGVIMLGTAPPPSGGDPAATSPNGHGIYVVVEDVDAHHERAVAAGAVIVYPPEDTEFGTRRNRVLDPEGYEWSFGTHSPAP